MPTTALEFMDLVDTLASCPRKYGVFLTAADKRAIRLYHGLIRAVIAGEAKRAQEKRYRDLGITPVSGEFE